MTYTICVCLILYFPGVFATVEPSLASLESRIMELEKRDQLLMQIIQGQAKTIQDQATNINVLSTTVKDLEYKHSEQGQVIKDMQKELDTIKKTVHTPDIKEPPESAQERRPINSPDHEVETFQNKVRQQIVSSSERTRKYLLNGAETVAFHATFSEPVHVKHHAPGTPIAFTHVLLNVGGGYHHSTSLFIAPMSGIYMFSASIMSELGNGGHPVHAGIMKNGTYLAGAFAMKAGAGDAGEQGSVSIATQLSIGEEVWVQHIVHNDGTIYGGGLTSFMGCLMQSL